MITKAKMIGAAMALGIVGALGGTAVAFADDIDQSVAQVEQSDASEVSNWFVRFGFAPRVAVAVPRVAVAAPRVVAPRYVAARRWVPGYWVGFRYHRGYWR